MVCVCTHCILDIPPSTGTSSYSLCINNNQICNTHAHSSTHTPTHHDGDYTASVVQCKHDLSDVLLQEVKVYILYTSPVESVVANGQWRSYTALWGVSGGG